MMSGIIKKKINLLGDPSVGKTSLTLRFVKNLFGDQYLKTIGTNVYTKKLERDDGTLKLVIHDIMGEKKYTAVQEGAFQNSNGAIAVADVTDAETLDSLIEDWLPRYHEVAGDDKPVALAINKCDLENKDITPDKILHELEGNFDSYVYTSAKMGIYVEELFEDIGTRSLSKTSERKKDITSIVLDRDIATPNELVSASLALSSEMTLMPYEVREKILKESGIDKFSLEEDIPESRALFFASGLSNWYNVMAEHLNEAKGAEYKKGANVFLKLIHKYYEGSSFSP